MAEIKAELPATAEREPVDHSSLILSRRRLLQEAASLAAFSLLPGCGYTSNLPSGDRLPLPLSPFVQGSLTVMATSVGVIPPRFMGLSYEKLTMSYGYFHPSNQHLIAMFRRLGPGLEWRTPGGARRSPAGVPASDSAGFAKKPTGGKTRFRCIDRLGSELPAGIGRRKGDPMTAFTGLIAGFTTKETVQGWRSCSRHPRANIIFCQPQK